jgi:hypothetical protein
MKQFKYRFQLPQVIVAIIILFQFVNFLVIPAYPSYDEAWQLQAAKSLSEGMGLTVSFDELSLIRISQGEFDLSTNTYNYLTGWPPLTSLIYSCFLLLFSTPLSLGLLKFIFVALGLWGWFLFIKSRTSNMNEHSIFMLFMGMLSFSNASTSMFAWALFPYIVIWLINIAEQRNTVRSAILVSMACAILVAFRYQMLSFVMSIPLFFLITKRRVNKTLFISILYVLPAFITYVAILYFNITYGVDIFAATKQFGIMRISTVPRALPYFLTHILIGYNFAYSRHIIIAIALAILTNVVFLYSIVRNHSAYDKMVLNVILAFGLVTFFQLAFNKDHAGYNIIINARYWMYLSPLILYMILDGYFRKPIIKFSALIQFGNRQVYLSAALVLCCVLCCAYFTHRTYQISQRYYNNYSSLTAMLDRVAHTNNFEPSETLVFIGMEDPNNLSSILLQYDKYPVFRRLDILNNDQVFISGNEKIVLMVHDSVAWQDRISAKWNRELLDNQQGYSMYLLSEQALCN